MEKVLEMLGAVVLAFVAMLLNTLIGVVIGWVVGLVFGDTILGVLSCLGISGFKMWQIGATLGFIASFFTAKANVKSNR